MLLINLAFALSSLNIKSVPYYKSNEEEEALDFISQKFFQFNLYDDGEVEERAHLFY